MWVSVYVHTKLLSMKAKSLGLAHGTQSASSWIPERSVDENLGNHLHHAPTDFKDGGQRTR